jgi:hypothetical protein
MNARAIELVAALRNITRTLLGSGGIGFYVPIAHEHDLVQIHPVNGRADELMAALRRLARALPGTTGIGFYGFVTCDLVQLTVATDADVYVLGRALELDVYEIRIGEGEGQGRWWLHAASHEEGNWIDLAGPHHEGCGHERAAMAPTSPGARASCQHGGARLRGALL